MINYMFGASHMSRFDTLAVTCLSYAYGAGAINGWMYIVSLLVAVTTSVLVQGVIK